MRRYDGFRALRPTRLAILGLAAGLWAAPGAWAQVQRPPEESVVKVRCSWTASPSRKAGEMVASGFVWRDRLHVVTALHAAVGCDLKLDVRSEVVSNSSAATVVKASLEGDLALLQLDRELGLPPIDHATNAPDTTGVYYTWGYRRNENEMTNVRTEFLGGLKRGETQLKSAYGNVQGIDGLLTGQDHPRGDTWILRVQTTLQPGQSGAPILDKQGRVVAIADGGLLGGYLGLNWSIPAYRYLPALAKAGAGDPIPMEASKWAMLFSETVPPETKVLPPPEVSDARVDLGALRHVRRLGLLDLDREYTRLFPNEEESTMKLLRQTVDPQELQKLSFDIYEESTTGATMAVPSNLAVSWNRDLQLLEARSASGAVRMFVGVMPIDPAQRSQGARRFAAKFLPFAEWKLSPAAINFDDMDAKHYPGMGDFIEGKDLETGSATHGLIYVLVDDKHLLGWANYEDSTLDHDDQVTSLMVVKSNWLSRFAVH